MIVGEKTVREIIYMLSVAFTLSLLVNYLSPKGIALKGQWDITQGVISANAKTDIVFRDIEIQTVEEAKKLYDSPDILFVDSRHTEMFSEGFIKGAISLSVYHYEDLIDGFIARYPIDQKMVTYCSGRECDESHKLASWLKEEGYTHIRVFIDGYPAWEKAGFPVERK